MKRKKVILVSVSLALVCAIYAASYEAIVAWMITRVAERRSPMTQEELRTAIDRVNVWYAPVVFMKRHIPGMYPLSEKYADFWYDKFRSPRPMP